MNDLVGRNTCGSRADRTGQGDGLSNVLRHVLAFYQVLDLRYGVGQVIFVVGSLSRFENSRHGDIGLCSALQTFKLKWHTGIQFGNQHSLRTRYRPATS